MVTKVERLRKIDRAWAVFDRAEALAQADFDKVRVRVNKVRANAKADFDRASDKFDRAWVRARDKLNKAVDEVGKVKL